MVLDVNEIILKKIKELEENKVIENAIEKKIESVVLQAIESAFNWEFSSEISKKLEEQIGKVAKDIKLNSYNTVIASTIKNICEVEMNEDLSKKVQAKIRELLLVPDKSVKFSDIVIKFKVINFEENEAYSYNVEEKNDDDGSFHHKKFNFCDENENGEKWSIGFLYSSYSKNWTISEFKHNDLKIFSFEGLSTLKHYDNFECLVLRTMLNSIPVEIDLTAENCEDILYQCID